MDASPNEDDPTPLRFVAPDDTHWTVYEIRDGRQPDSGHALIFVSDDGFRRVRRYPADWRLLDAAALWELSWDR